MTVAVSIDEATMYRALVERDASYEGLFVVGVKTTGIFCRPTCPARKPLARNVEFFSDAQGAIDAGYRACKRCVPTEPSSAHPEWAARILEALEGESGKRISDSELAGFGVDPATVRRYFRERFGMTFHAYQRTQRLGLALERVQSEGASNGVAFHAGFESDSGFRDAFKKLFGVTPGRAAGASMVKITLLTTPIGLFVAGATDESLCLLEFADRPMLGLQADRLGKLELGAMVPGVNGILAQAREELDEYFSGDRRHFDVPLLIRGTDFQERVWRELCEIPFGTTISYGELAGRLGSPGASRAVGKANGDNRIAVVIPCHRVIAADGTLHGYGGGLWRKRFLLEHEQGGLMKKDTRSG